MICYMRWVWFLKLKKRQWKPGFLNIMINKKNWKEFQETGLLWWIHLFGWAIVLETNDSGEIFAYPNIEDLVLRD